MNWDPAKHPRKPKGVDGGGQFEDAAARPYHIDVKNERARQAALRFARSTKFSISRRPKIVETTAEERAAYSTKHKTLTVPFTKRRK